MHIRTKLAIDKLSTSDLTEYNAAIDTAIMIGRLADAATSLTVFTDYQKLKSQNTLQAQHRDLRLFGNFINELYEKAERANIQIPFRLRAGQLYRDPATWKLITHGLVKLFKSYLENEGYSITSINRALSTVRKYAGLAASAEQIEPNTNALIQAVKGFLGAEERHLNAERSITRKSTKKEKAVSIPKKVIQALKAEHTFPDTEIGIRDRLIMCLLFDHGLRSSEIAGLRVENFDLSTGSFLVYRMKTNSKDRLTLTADSGDALQTFLNLSLPPLPYSDDKENPGEPLLRGGNRVGVLRAALMSRSSVSKVVTKYGKLMAIEHNLPSLNKLSAHDGRHQWATDVLQSGAQVDQLQQAGGWKSPSMPLRYVNKRVIADEGIKLDR
ncbi:MAG: integrase [Cellvibrionaceae bacterium]|jgi:integrase